MISESVESVTIPKGIYGWPGIAFGGYVAGLLGSNGDRRVDFLRPTPLGVPLSLTSSGDESRLDGEEGPLARSRPAELNLDPPAPPTWKEALAASDEHMSAAPVVATAADCFGCGHAREDGAGLRQLLGRHPSRDLVAAAWRPASGLGGDDGMLPIELVWAAMDCPGGMARGRLTTAPESSLTANLTTSVLRPVAAGERHVAYGWVISREGRKTVVGSAVADESGELCAVAEALWIDAR